LEKLYYSGLDSPEQYIDLVYNYNESVATNFLVTDGGLGEKQSAKIVVELCRVLKSKIPIKLLMVASGCFEKGGMGKRKLEQLEAAGLSMGELLTMSPETIRSEVPKIKGFNTTTAEILVAGVIEFRKWYKRVKTMLDVDGEIPKKKVRAKGLPLAGLKVAWTSYRSKDEEKTVEENGGDIVKYGASMDILLYRETARFMDKIEKAGAKAITWDKFCIKYGVK